MATYASIKTKSLITKRNNDIFTTISDHAFNSDDIFDNSLGLDLAVGFTAYDNNQEIILDKTIGELRYVAYSWGEDENGNGFVKREKLPTRQCTREELGLDPGESRFFPLREYYVNQVNFYHKKFLCVDREEMLIYGDFSTQKARLIDLQLIKCHDQDYCKSDEEIMQFMKDKWLVLLTNRIRFDPDKFRSEAFV